MVPLLIQKVETEVSLQFSKIIFCQLKQNSELMISLVCSKYYHSEFNPSSVKIIEQMKYCLILVFGQLGHIHQFVLRKSHLCFLFNMLIYSQKVKQT